MSEPVPQPLAAQIEQLRETDAQKYGLLVRYHADMKQGIEACSHAYPCTKQFLPSLKNQALTPQMVGNLLSLLGRLDILGTYSNRSNSNRYDLTQYDPARMEELIEILENESTE